MATGNWFSFCGIIYSLVMTLNLVIHISQQKLINLQFAIDLSCVYCSVMQKFQIIIEDREIYFCLAYAVLALCQTIEDYDRTNDRI